MQGGGGKSIKGLLLASARKPDPEPLELGEGSDPKRIVAHPPNEARPPKQGTTKWTMPPVTLPTFLGFKGTDKVRSRHAAYHLRLYFTISSTLAVCIVQLCSVSLKYLLY